VFGNHTAVAPTFERWSVKSDLQGIGLCGLAEIRHFDCSA